MSWSNDDPITDIKMNKMTGNDQYLYEKSINAAWMHEGQEVTQGIKIWAGTGRFPLEPAKTSVLPVAFNGFFSAACNPIVTATPGRRNMNRLWVSVRGPGDSNWPTSAGCEVHGIMDPDTPDNYVFSINIPVHIIAVGW